LYCINLSIISFIDKIDVTPNTRSQRLIYFFLSVFTFLAGAFLATTLAGAFFITFFTTAFLTGALVTTGLATILTTGLVTFLPRYFELSNARIGMKTILINRSPSPYVQCFQNLAAILKKLIIIKTINTGGTKIHRKFRPDRPPSLNIRYRL
jgi:hypothetical protein